MYFCRVEVRGGVGLIVIRGRLYGENTFNHEKNNKRTVKFSLENRCCAPKTYITFSSYFFSRPGKAALSSQATSSDIDGSRTLDLSTQKRRPI